MIAIAGFLAGHHGAARSTEEPTRIAYERGIALEYPQSWQRVNTVAPIPGLQLTAAVLLSPGGDSRRAGLLSGQLPAGEASPLPAGLVSLMQGLPRTEIVDFPDVQAYRYTGVRIAGYQQTLELYVIPNPGAAPTALACYAAPQAASYLAQCETIVARLTPVGRSQYGLKPDAAYSAQLGALIGAFDGERLALRHQMAVTRDPASVARLATTLAGRMATAAASIRTLQAPPGATLAQAALASSIDRTAQTYRALGGAAAAGQQGGVAEAQKRLDGAEAGIDLSLEAFALLGYQHS